MSHLKVLAKQIAHYGVQHVFGIPGSGTSLTLIDHLQQLGVQFHLVHFEGCAAIMAGTMGRLSNSCGVSVGIKGPGLANMLPGMAACSLDSLPAVNITEAYLPDSPVSLAHKRLDHLQLVSSIAKTSVYWSETGSTFKTLAQTAEAECPGPVHLDITGTDPCCHGEDILEDEIAPDSCGDVFRALEKSRRPLLIVGSLSLRKRLNDQLNAVDIPVFTTASAKGVVDETLSHAAGVYTGVGLEFAAEDRLIEEADLIVAIGLRYNEVLSVKQFPCDSVLLDPLGDGAAGDFGFSHISWIKEKKVWQEFWQRFEGLEWGKTKIAESRKQVRRSLLDHGFMPAHVLVNVNKYFSGKARLVVDTGLFCTVAEHIWPATLPALYIGSGQGRYMGISLPQGIAASIYDPTLPTIIFCGDGSVGMFISELKLAVRNKLPLIVILCSDGKFGTLRGRAVRDGLSEDPLTIASPSWMAVMEGLGFNSACADSENALCRVLQEWDHSPLFIETLFDADSYMTMTRKIR
ncbi:MAG TPA: thiamine pyrophosphate-binding protein [Desulfobacterales bacterium]|nr:thiamine pyrophosphate-binding protein [Desulfobacterales bacterium]HIP39610.1 thiamine pyrophosphate-binding protein [Desulfocapsa sulfexigens]